MRMIRRGSALVAVVLTVLAAHAATASASEPQEPEPVGTTSLPTAVSPAGEPGPYQVRNVLLNGCLDVSHEGWVELQSCNHNDGGQRWIIWNGGWVKNQATGRCLVPADAFLDTDECARVTYQYWQYWTPQWFQNVAYGMNGCLDAPYLGREARFGRCEYRLGMYWDVRIWS